MRVLSCHFLLLLISGILGHYYCAAQESSDSLGHLPTNDVDSGILEHSSSQSRMARAMSARSTATILHSRESLRLRDDGQTVFSPDFIWYSPGHQEKFRSDSIIQATWQTNFEESFLVSICSSDSNWCSSPLSAFRHNTAESPDRQNWTLCITASTLPFFSQEAKFVFLLTPNSPVQRGYSSSSSEIEIDFTREKITNATIVVLITVILCMIPCIGCLAYFLYLRGERIKKFEGEGQNQSYIDDKNASDRFIASARDAALSHQGFRSSLPVHTGSRFRDDEPSNALEMSNNESISTTWSNDDSDMTKYASSIQKYMANMYRACSAGSLASTMGNQETSVNKTTFPLSSELQTRMVLRDGRPKDYSKIYRDSLRLDHNSIRSDCRACTVTDLDRGSSPCSTILCENLTEDLRFRVALAPQISTVDLIGAYCSCLSSSTRSSSMCSAQSLACTSISREINPPYLKHKPLPRIPPVLLKSEPLCSRSSAGTVKSFYTDMSIRQAAYAKQWRLMGSPVMSNKNLPADFS